MSASSARCAKKVLLVFFFILLVASVSAEARQKKASCKDKDHRCRVWSRDGKCANVGVGRSCPKSCGICSEIDEEQILTSLSKSADQTMFILLMFLSFFIIGIFVAIVKVYNAGNCCLSKGSMKGKTVVITGGTSGIGFETVFHLARRGARVIIGCKNLKKGFKLVTDLRKQTGQKFIEMKKLDLGSLQSVRDFAQELIEELDKIDILVNNAAVITSRNRSTTTDQYEETFQVNYLSHFLLTKLLANKLKENGSGRVLNVCDFSAAKNGKIDFTDLQGKKYFSNLQAYNNSKLAMLLFTKEASQVLKNSKVTVNAVDPGRCYTNLWRNYFPYNQLLFWLLIKPYTYLFWMSPDMGAETTYYCSLDKDIEKVTGKCYKNCLEIPIPETDSSVVQKLWEVSERLIQPKRLSNLTKETVEGISKDEGSDQHEHDD